MTPDQYDRYMTFFAISMGRSVGAGTSGGGPRMRPVLPYNPNGNAK
ncbi:MAG: hypothetical protein O6831_12150 [Alphaproteobacteria bacterium]|nr:hypothetical protein [Alphaproteobacteria bacterium]